MTNTFVNCQIDLYGYANGSNLTCYFEENLAYGPYTAGKRHHVFINEVNKANSAVYKIKNNNLSGKDIGVSLQNDNGSTIFNNIITIDMSVVPNITYSGVELINVDNSFITDNTINCNNGTVLLNTSVRGIASSTCSNNTYACNSIRNTGVCLKFEGNCPSNIWKNKLNINRGVGCKYGIWLDNGGYTGPIIYSPNGPGLNEFGDFDYGNSGADTHVSSGTGSSIAYTGASNSSNIYFPLTNTAAFGLTAYNPSFVSGSNLYDCGFSNRELKNVAVTNESSENNEITVYPNPAENDLYIKTGLDQYTIQVMDISGRVVKNELLHGYNRIDISALNDGVYIYKVIGSDNVQLKTGKFVVSH
jgi:hypothetical protein